MTSWRLDETAHAGAEHLEAEYVAGYDRKAGFDPAEDIALLREHGLSPASTVLDMGAGTGTFAIAVAPACKAVTAVDISAPMVAAIRAKVAAAGLSNVTVEQGGFFSYGHRGGGPFDVIYCRHALHQVPDFWKALALQRLAALLRSGGTLLVRDLIFDFEPADADEQMAAWMAGSVDDPRIGWTAEELAEHVRGEHSTFRWLFEPMLLHAGFEIVQADYWRAAYGRYLCRHTR
jgi:SAM-dependent methyltransferase